MLWDLLTTDAAVAPVLTLQLCALLDAASLRSLSACARNLRADDNRLVLSVSCGTDSAAPELPPLAHTRLFLRLQPFKGWGVFTATPLPEACRVLVYTGALARNTAASGRGMTFTLTVREHFPSGCILRTNIDAEHVGGGLARFVNHSCDPNLHVVLWRRDGDSLVPLPVFATKRAVRAGEELTFHYHGAEQSQSQSQSETRCLCRSSTCSGFLP